MYRNSHGFVVVLWVQRRSIIFPPLSCATVLLEMRPHKATKNRPPIQRVLSIISHLPFSQDILTHLRHLHLQPINLSMLLAPQECVHGVQIPFGNSMSCNDEGKQKKKRLEGGMGGRWKMIFFLVVLHVELYDTKGTFWPRGAICFGSFGVHFIQVIIMTLG